jgi:uncharacterized protein RhaS with RHS repeats
MRQYSPVQGRWIAPDPVALVAANLANPQSRNRYAYVGNNPLSDTDPSGGDGCDSSVDICADFFFFGFDQNTIYSSWTSSDGSQFSGLQSTTFDPWFGSLGATVFSDPVLTNAANTMNLLTAGYGAISHCLPRWTPA